LIPIRTIPHADVRTPSLQPAHRNKPEPLEFAMLRTMPEDIRGIYTTNVIENQYRLLFQTTHCCRRCAASKEAKRIASGNAARRYGARYAAQPHARGAVQRNVRQSHRSTRRCQQKRRAQQPQRYALKRGVGA